MEDLGVEIDFQILVKLVHTNLVHCQIDAHSDFLCCLSNVNNQIYTKSCWKIINV